MRSLNIGRLVHDVLIQQLTLDQVDASGAPIEPWTTLKRAWMGRPTPGRINAGGEVFRADQISGSITTQWTMRYDPAMDTDLVDVLKTRRLLYQGRAYDIVSAEVMDRQQGILLRTIASSRVAA